MLDARTTSLNRPRQPPPKGRVVPPTTSRARPASTGSALSRGRLTVNVLARRGARIGRRAHHCDVPVRAWNAQVNQYVKRMSPVKWQVVQSTNRVVGIHIGVVAKENVRQDLVLLIAGGSKDRALPIWQDQHVCVIRPRDTDSREQERRYQ